MLIVLFQNGGCQLMCQSAHIVCRYDCLRQKCPTYMLSQVANYYSESSL